MSAHLPPPVRRLNLCGGSVRVPGYIHHDIVNADVVFDLEEVLLPFPDASLDAVICISAINYFAHQRAAVIIQDVYRALKPGGVARFASQDLRILCRRYIDRDAAFFFEKLADGSDRFPGHTFGEKLNRFFSGFATPGGKHCKYVYDFESLRLLFVNAGFEVVEQVAYRQSALEQIELIDNRPEQMFFLEARKGGEGSGILKGAPHHSSPEGVATETSSAAPSSAVTRRTTALEAAAAAADSESCRALAERHWKAGDLDRAWAHYLACLDLNPNDRIAVDHCEKTLVSLGRHADAASVSAAFSQE